MPQSDEPTRSTIEIGPRTSLSLLVAEASRQLDICNACRYCEGLCAVFPALERRRVLDRGDISQIANLCHDCRACYDACMYTPPHEFALNIPVALSAVRTADYDDYVWPATVPRLLRGWLGVVTGLIGAAAVVLLVSLVNIGWAGLVDPHASPYELTPYPALLTMLLVPTVFSAVVMGAAAYKYWKTTGGIRVGFAAVRRAIWEAASLRYLRGAGVECPYPDDEKPSAARRRLHGLVAYGFGLCFVSTTAAGIEQDLLGIRPPYPWLSVPVLSGFVGGVMLVVGCVGLLVLKARSSDVTSFSSMTVKDYGFLIALAYLSFSGLASLFARDSHAYGIVYLMHVSGVMLCFAAAPYTKFMHIVFRFAALIRDNAERVSGAARSVAAPH